MISWELIRFDEIEQEQPIVVARSWWSDSTFVLQKVLDYYRSRHRDISQIHAVYIDHHTRPESTAIIDDLKTIDCTFHHIDFLGEFSETSAREFRRTALRDYARTINAKIVIMGHHFDDRIETALMRLHRWGIFWLRSIQRSTYRDGLAIVRPLIDIPKNVILQHITMKFHDDPSNYQEFTPRNTIRNMCKQYQSDQRYEWWHMFFERLQVEYTIQSLDISWSSYDVWIWSSRDIILWLKNNGCRDISRAHCERIVWLENAHSWKILYNKYIITQCHGMLYILQHKISNNLWWCDVLNIDWNNTLWSLNPLNMIGNSSNDTSLWKKWYTDATMSSIDESINEPTTDLTQTSISHDHCWFFPSIYSDSSSDHWSDEWITHIVWQKINDWNQLQQQDKCAVKNNSQNNLRQWSSKTIHRFLLKHQIPWFLRDERPLDLWVSWRHDLLTGLDQVHD